MASTDGVPRLRTRRAARLLVLDPGDRLLLFRFVDPVNAKAFWITAGGGLEGNESFEAAAERELLEETGIRFTDLAEPVSGCVWTRNVIVGYGSDRFRQSERFYLCRVHDQTIDTTGQTGSEQTDLTEWRWWTVREIAACPECVAPADLAARLEDLLQNGLPSEPIRIDAV